MKKRIYLFDNLKFLLIIFVVMGHLADMSAGVKEFSAYQSLFIFIYAFHMPLFIFISGLFHKNEQVFLPAIRYVGIGITMKALIFFTKWALWGSAPEWGLFVENNVVWYMFALAGFHLLSYALKGFPQKWVLAIALILAVFSGFLPSTDILAGSRILIFFPFYLLGTILNSSDIVKIGKQKYNKVIGAVLIGAWAVLCIVARNSVYLLRPLMTGRHSYNALNALSAYGILMRVLCYAISFLLCYAFLCVMPNQKIPLVSRFGQRTLGVYFWHSALIYILLHFGYHALLFQSAVGRVLYLLTAIGITLLLSLKPFMYPAKLFLKYEAKSKN